MVRYGKDIEKAVLARGLRYHRRPGAGAWQQDGGVPLRGRHRPVGGEAVDPRPVGLAAVPLSRRGAIQCLCAAFPARPRRLASFDVEGAARNAEGPGRLRDVSTGIGYRREDGLLFEIFEPRGACASRR